ncbi:hypothetical protein ACKO5U_002772, partial [Enterococcus hirae]
KHQLLEISLNFSKHEKLFQKILSYCHQSYPMFSRPLIHGETKAASSEISSYFLMLLLSQPH